MVFFSSCMEVKFFHELLNYIDISVTCIHVGCLLCFMQMLEVVVDATNSALDKLFIVAERCIQLNFITVYFWGPLKLVRHIRTLSY